MKELIDRTMKLGFDLLSVGKKHGKIVASDLRKHYKLTEPQARRLAADLNKHIQAAEKDTLKLVESNLKGIVPRGEFNKVKRALRTSPKKRRAIKKATRKPPTKRKPNRRKK